MPNYAYINDFNSQPTGTISNAIIRNCHDSVLCVQSLSTDPMIPMYDLGSFNPNTYKYIAVKYRVLYNTPGYIEIFFLNSRRTSPHADQRVESANLNTDGQWRVINIDMSVHQYWTHSNVTGWRFDFATQANTVIEIDYIALVDTPISYTAPSVPDTQWLSGWSYRKKLTCTDADGGGTGITLCLNIGQSSSSPSCDVHCENHALSSFNDIRFTSIDGVTLQPYWIESITGDSPGKVAKVWVKLLDLPKNGGTFYLYYGNAQATSLVDPNTVFDLFESFEFGSVDDDLVAASNGKWSYDSSSHAHIDNTHVVDGTRSALLLGGITTNNGIATSLATMGLRNVTGMRLYKHDGAGIKIIHGNNARTRAIQINIYSSEDIIYYDGSDRDTGYDCAVNQFFTIELRDVNWTQNSYNIYYNDTLIKSGATMRSCIWYDALYVNNYNSSANVHVWVDLVYSYVRKSDTHTNTWYSEETAPVTSSSSSTTSTSSSSSTTTTTYDPNLVPICPSYLGYDIFDIEPNWATPPQITPINRLHISQNIGVSFAYDPYDETQWRLAYEYLFTNKLQSRYVIDFFNRQKGRYGCFWLPSWIQDIRFANGFSALDTHFIVENTSYAQLWRYNKIQGRYLWILFPNGQYEIRKILNFVTPTMMRLNGPLYRTCSAEEAQSLLCCFLYFVRFDMDALELQYESAEISSTKLIFKTLHLEQEDILTVSTTTTTTSTSTSSTSSSTSTTTTTTSTSTSSTSSSTSTTTTTTSTSTSSTSSSTSTTTVTAL